MSDQHEQDQDAIPVEDVQAHDEAVVDEVNAPYVADTEDDEADGQSPYEPDVAAGEEGYQPPAEPDSAPARNVDLQAEQYEQARVDPDYARKMAIEVDPDDVEVLVPSAGEVVNPDDVVTDESAAAEAEAVADEPKDDEGEVVETDAVEDDDSNGEV